MDNPTFEKQSSEPNDRTLREKIKRVDKIIIGFLVIVVIILTAGLINVIISAAAPPTVPHNTIIVRGLDPSMFSFRAMEFTFQVNPLREIKNYLPSAVEYDQEISPDGEWIVASISDYIYIMKADGSQQTLLPTEYGGIHPTWSPDGKQIAFYGYDKSNRGIIITSDIGCLLRGEQCAPTLHLLVRVIGNWDQAYPYPDWSPDGRLILFHDWHTQSAYTIGTQGQSQLKVISTKIDQPGFSPPRWSPDGTKIVGTCLLGGIPNICIMDTDGNDLTYLTHETELPGTRNPIWSPDGQKIAYIKNYSTDPIPAVWDGLTIYPQTIYIISVDGQEYTHLPYKKNFHIRWFTWFP